MSKGIRLKALAVLSGFLSLYALSIILNSQYNSKKDEITEFENTVNNVQTLLLKDALTINDFFLIEVDNLIFFTTGYSSYLEEHRVYVSSIKSKIDFLISSDLVDQFDLKNRLELVLEKVKIYEKDFDLFLSTLNKSEKSKDKLTGEIKELKVTLDEQKMFILNEISEISKYTVFKKKRISSKLRYFFEIIAIATLLLGLGLSLILSKKTTKRIIKLSEVISNFVQSKFTDIEDVDIKKGNDEIGQLINDFLILRTEVWNQINYLEDNIHKRTEEILHQKEELQSQRDEVIGKNQLIQKQNKKILDSLRYAKTIQEAFMPDKKLINDVFPENFVIWKPKDLVSGDFYWLKCFPKSNFSILAVVDCTGHGVPGGFMSMLGNSLLNEIVLRKNNYDAATILNLLRDRVIETLQAKDKEIVSNDGMDVALIVVNHEKNILQFSGANRPLYLVRNGIVNKISGDKMPIGTSVKGNKTFSNHEIKLLEDDSIYLLSDGFTDQFGEVSRRTFRSNQLKSLLTEYHNKPMIEQGGIYNTVFDNWKGNLEQTDDVLFIGIKPKLCIGSSFTRDVDSFSKLTEISN